LDMACPVPIDLKDRPQFPYNLQFCLTDSEFRKFKKAGQDHIDPADAFVGGIVHIHALARITSVSANQTESGEKRRVEFQIEDLGVESEDAENEDD
jgi:hypothetical protein